MGFLLALVTIVGLWMTFQKAGQPGWASIIPLYNIYIMSKIVGQNGWLNILLLLIPLVNIVILIMLAHGLSKSFGKGAGFTIGLIFLPFIFYPILGFGNATYIGPNGQNAVSEQNVDGFDYSQIKG